MEPVTNPYELDIWDITQLKTWCLPVAKKIAKTKTNPNNKTVTHQYPNGRTVTIDCANPIRIPIKVYRSVEEIAQFASHQQGSTYTLPDLILEHEIHFPADTYVRNPHEAFTRYHALITAIEATLYAIYADTSQLIEVNKDALVGLTIGTLEEDCQYDENAPDFLFYGNEED